MEHFVTTTMDEMFELIKKFLGAMNAEGGNEKAYPIARAPRQQALKRARRDL
jgi:hypothetical protein